MDETLSPKEKWSYGCGDVGNNIVFGMMSSFLLFFYTDVAFLPAAAVGTLMLVSRVFDALIDPAIGVVVDRTRTRLGKARPYLLVAPLPLSILLVMLFSSPPHTLNGKLIYAFVTLIFMGLVYSFVNIPYASLMALMTRDPHQKMQLSGMRTAGSAIGSALVQALTVPLAMRIGFDRHGFSISAAIFSAVTLTMFLVVFFNSKERFVDRSLGQPMHFSETLASLARNRTFIVVFIYSFLNLVRVGVVIGSAAYFALDVLHRQWMISLLLTVMSLASIVSAVVSPPLFRRFGIRKGNWVALSFGLVCFAALPLAQERISLFLAIYTLAHVAMGATNTSIWAMSSYAIDYQQWRFDTRSDGLVMAAISLSTKVGIAAGISLVAYMLGWAHFDPLHIGPSSILAIREAFYGGSLLFTALLFLCMCFYNMDKLHLRMVHELNTRSSMDV